MVKTQNGLQSLDDSDNNSMEQWIGKIKGWWLSSKNYACRKDDILI